MPASSYAAAAIESRKPRAGGAAVDAESVAKFGISMTVLGKRGVTVETARMHTGGPADPGRRLEDSLEGGRRAGPPSLVAQISSTPRGLATTGDSSSPP